METTIKSTTTLLKYTYGLVPIVAGLDKFTNLLVDWGQYAVSISGTLPLDLPIFMGIIGVIEIVAGVLVLTKTKIGALMVSFWLFAIALVLLVGGAYDIAVRDIVMAIGAYSLSKLSEFE